MARKKNEETVHRHREVVGGLGRLGEDLLARGWPLVEVGDVRDGPPTKVRPRELRERLVVRGGVAAVALYGTHPYPVLGGHDAPMGPSQKASSSSGAKPGNT